MNILLVNDDGISSTGLWALAGALARDHAVTVVAPNTNRSAVGHGLTIGTPLFAHRADFPHGVSAWAVNGTPADCTRLGILNFAPGPIDLVISGPNKGCNLASDLPYSGTVAAALEASMMDVKAIAVSAPREADEQQTIETFLLIFDLIDVENDFTDVLNINIPDLPITDIKGLRWAKLGSNRWRGPYELRDSSEPDFDGQSLYHLPSTPPKHVPGGQNDYDLLLDGFITLTPLTFRMDQPIEGRRDIPWE